MSILNLPLAATLQIRHLSDPPTSGPLNLAHAAHACALVEAPAASADAVAEADGRCAAAQHHERRLDDVGLVGAALDLGAQVGDAGCARQGVDHGRHAQAET